MSEIYLSRDEMPFSKIEWSKKGNVKIIFERSEVDEHFMRALDYIVRLKDYEVVIRFNDNDG
jgi:hypothetical protein